MRKPSFFIGNGILRDVGRKAVPVREYALKLFPRFSCSASVIKPLYNLFRKPLLCLHRMGSLDRIYILRCQQLIVPYHKLIINRHNLPEYLLWRLLYTYIILLALAHLFYAIKTFKQWHCNDYLRFLTILFLEVPSNKKIKPLISPAHLHISFQHDRVITLYQRVQEFMNTY